MATAYLIAWLEPVQRDGPVGLQRTVMQVSDVGIYSSGPESITRGLIDGLPVTVLQQDGDSFGAAMINLGKHLRALIKYRQPGAAEIGEMLGPELPGGEPW